MVKVMSLLIKPESALGFVFGVRAQTEMKIWCTTGMCMLKVVSSEANLGANRELSMNLFINNSV